MFVTIIVAVMVATGFARVNNERGPSSASDTGQVAKASSARSGPKARTACEVLTASEIASVLRVPQVKKESSQKNEMTEVDFCYWYVTAKVDPNKDERLEVRLWQSKSGDERSGMVFFIAAKGVATGYGDHKAEPVRGVGDEAIYAPYPGGGSVALRAGRSAVTISGLVSKDALISMARLATQKL